MQIAETYFLFNWKRKDVLQEGIAVYLRQHTDRTRQDIAV
jgi:hypothetical protein